MIGRGFVSVIFIVICYRGATIGSTNGLRAGLPDPTKGMFLMELKFDDAGNIMSSGTGSDLDAYLAILNIDETFDIF